MMDLSTEHQRHTKKMSNHLRFKSSSDSDSMSVSDSSTTVSPKSKKRKIRSDNKTSRKQPAKKRARKTSDTTDVTVGKFYLF
jgi:hypothetical protein